MKESTLKLLNGMGIGVIIALLPQAMLGNLLGLFDAPHAQMLIIFSTFSMGLIIGVCIAMQFQLDMISTCTVALTTMVAGGSVRTLVEGAVHVQGSGDLINMGIGAGLSLLLISLLGNRLGVYKLLVLPMTSLVIIGWITSLTLAPVTEITNFIGSVVEHFTYLQPLWMSILLAISFALIIVSPLSSVAIALMIEVSGIGSAAANVGIIALAFTLAIYNYQSNGLGTALAHFLGSPKLQLPNFMKKPIMVLPALASSALAAIAVPIFEVVGTPMSAGFGLAGLVGPLGHLGIVGFETNHIIVAGMVFVVIPAVTSFAMVYLFRDVLKIVKNEDYRLKI